MPFGGVEDRQSRHGYSFGSICSFRSIKRNGSQNSQKQGTRPNNQFDYDSNESVELLMMKSAKSANVDLMIRPENNKRRNSVFGKVPKSYLTKTNKVNKQSKAREIMRSYFMDTDSIGDNGSETPKNYLKNNKSLGSENGELNISGSNKISNLINQLGHVTNGV